MTKYMLFSVQLQVEESSGSCEDNNIHDEFVISLMVLTYPWHNISRLHDQDKEH